MSIRDHQSKLHGEAQILKGDSHCYDYTEHVYFSWDVLAQGSYFGWVLIDSTELTELTDIVQKVECSSVQCVTKVNITEKEVGRYDMWE